MNKYKLKIIPENGMFIGQAYLEDQLVYSTSPCKDTISCSRALALYLGKTQSPSPLPAQRTNSAVNIPPAPIQGTMKTAPSQQAVRKCCGRG